METSVQMIQAKLLDAFKWFHAFCGENQLKYYALGGTVLGAVRHHGFIPWDDDIDVGMPRRDYERFLKLTEGKIINGFLTESYHSGNKDFIYPYAKVYDTKTTLVETARFPVRRGIYIDVFPLDGIGDSSEEAKRNYKPIKMNYNLLCTASCALNGERSWYKNAGIVLARAIPSAILNTQKLIEKIDRMCRHIDYDDAKYVGNLVGNWGFREIAPKEVFGEPQEYVFEDAVIYSVERYDEYLTLLYGDYMTLPPEEKRCSHHDSIECDLEKAYLQGMTTEY